MEKSYSKYKKELKTINCLTKETKKDFFNSLVYQRIKNFFPQIIPSRCFFANVTSMCLNNAPKAIRIRNDHFLKLVSKNDFDCALISIIHYLNQYYYFIFLGKSFFGYPFKTNVSNSFIHFDFDEIFNENNFNNSWPIKTKKINIKDFPITKYYYLLINKNTNNVNDIDNYCKLIQATILKQYCNNNSNDASISQKIKNEIWSIYPKRCICSIEPNNICYSKNTINWDTFEQNAFNNLIHIHHLIPKEYFKLKYQNPNDLNWDIINDVSNLVPICSYCHYLIHNGNDVEKNTIFSKIFDVFKKLNIFDKFNNYLNLNKNYISLDINKILKLYRK